MRGGVVGTATQGRKKVGRGQRALRMDQALKSRPVAEQGRRRKRRKGRRREMMMRRRRMG